MKNSASACARLLLWTLVAIPAMLLLARTVALARPAVPVVSVLRDGRQILSIPLARDALERASGERRLLLADGSVRVFAATEIVGRHDAPKVWIVRTEDAPPRMGWIRALVAGASDTLRGADLEDRLDPLREGRRADRDRLVKSVRASKEGAGFALAMERWNLFRREDERVGVLLEDGEGGISFVRLSSVREFSRPPDGPIRYAFAWAENLAQIFSDTPDAWGIGGLREVFVGTVVLIFLSGCIGGTLAILAALLLSERLRSGRWAMVVRRSSEWLAAVPGVVWGAVGFGFLVSVVGTEIDHLFEGRLRWATGGLLWASLTLGILAVPLSLKRALDSLDAVPRQWRLVARSCGATRWQVLRMVVFPVAWPSLLGAWFSAFARAAGETAPLMLVGAVHSVSGDVFGSGPRFPSLSGGFPHLGVLACDPPWPPIEAELGHPSAFLSLLSLSLLCVAFELAASIFLAKGRRAIESEVSA